MSISGKIRRGKKWYIQRDIDGNYPDYIERDAHKKDEINFYLDSIKVEESVSEAKPKPKEKK